MEPNLEDSIPEYPDPRDNPHWISEKVDEAEYDREQALIAEVREQTDPVLTKAVELFDRELVMNPLFVGQEQSISETQTYSTLRSDKATNQRVVDVAKGIEKKRKKDKKEPLHPEQLRDTAERSLTTKVEGYKKRSEEEARTLEEVLRAIEEGENSVQMAMEFVGIDKTRPKRYKIAQVLTDAATMFDYLLIGKGEAKEEFGLTDRTEFIFAAPEAIEDEDMNFVKRLSMLVLVNARERERAWSQELDNLPVNLNYARKFGRELKSNQKEHEQIIDRVVSHDTQMK